MQSESAVHNQAGPTNKDAYPNDAHLCAKSICRKGATILAALFFLLHLPGLPKLSHWRGDERFYTDAAVQMALSGDYLTPKYPDGALRFKKPILPYWAVLAGIKLFGFNYLACRLAFLIAGALSVWLCFELCIDATAAPSPVRNCSYGVKSDLAQHKHPLHTRCAAVFVQSD